MCVCSLPKDKESLLLVFSGFPGTKSTRKEAGGSNKSAEKTCWLSTSNLHVETLPYVCMFVEEANF